MKRYYSIILTLFAVSILIAANLDLNAPLNYANQNLPNYISKDNTPQDNPITDLGATLGRVLFYDKNLSYDNTISCASCHKQEFAFGDTAVVSEGINGVTGRHSMRLINSRFADELNFFWDERASSLEEQTTMPIQDHIEMGFSGTNGNEGIDSLIDKLSQIQYYNDLFEAAFGDTVISEQRIQYALSQFVRSIQSFDSKFDVGRAMVNDEQDNFPNFTPSENNGKTIFLDPPPLGGAGCGGCHRAPEFDIDPLSQNNGVIGVVGSTSATDLFNTKAPSLRDIVNSNGVLNGPLMHDGSITSLEDVVDHYNLVPNNANLDPRLQGPGGNLQLTANEKTDLVNFLKTLGGTNVYTDERWSDPFDSNGDIDITPLLNASYENIEEFEYVVYPNPGTLELRIKGWDSSKSLIIFDSSGKVIYNSSLEPFYGTINTRSWNTGTYFLKISDAHGISTLKWIKQ